MNLAKQNIVSFYLITFMFLSRIVKVSCSKYPSSSLRGRLLTPRDIHFDDEIKRSLTAIREAATPPPEASTSTSLPSSTTGKARTEIRTRQNFDNHSKRSKALSSLASAGIINDYGVTLTLIGYKGGDLDKQINQDRAFVLAPFYITDDKETSEIGDKVDLRQEADKNYRNRLGDGIHDGNDKNNSYLQGQAMQLMGVMDGHDRLGEIVSEYAMRVIPSVISSKLNELQKVHKSLFFPTSPKKTQDHDALVKKVLEDSFLHINATIPTKGHGGCTASVLLLISNKAYIANVGDSRTFVVVFYRDTKNVDIVYQTREDKPHLDAERRRIEDMGGEVYIPSKESMDSGEDSSRTVILDQSTGFQQSLAMSRSLGDWDFSSAGVIALPTVDVVDLNQYSQHDSKVDERKCDEVTSKGKNTCQYGRDVPKIFAVAASDGLLDFISPDELATTLAYSLYDGNELTPHPVSASEQLILKAAEKWHQEMGYEYRDDIAISVMKLN